MKFLAVVIPLLAIYHVCSNSRTLWEDSFKPVNMTSYVRRTVRKYREIKNGEKYIILDIFYNLDHVEKREVTSS